MAKMSEIWIALIALAGGIAGTVSTYFTQRGKSKAERDNIAVSTADKVVELVNEQLDAVRTELKKAGEERQMTLRYIAYLHDELAKYKVPVMTFEEWKDEYAETT